MKKGIARIAFAVTMLLTAGCSRDPANEAASKPLEYTVARVSPVPGGGCNIDARLNRRVSETTIKAMDTDIRRMHCSSTAPALIGYYLPGMEVGAGAWATSRFDGSIEVKILGLTEEETATLASEAKQRSTTVGDVLGRWIDDRWAGVITIYRQRNQYLAEVLFKDRSLITRRLAEKPSKQGRRFNIRGTEFGEYYVIDADGNLKQYDADGLITTAQKVNSH